MTNSSNQNNTRYSRLLIAAFVATLMLPACVLIFTDGYSFLRALSAVLLPTGFYLLWSVAHKRSGMMVCWGLLWFILAALQLVLLYMFGSSIIAVDMFTNLFTTNPNEAGELLSNIWPMVTFVVVLYIPVIALAVHSLRQGFTIAPSTRRTAAVVGAVMIVAGCATTQFNVFPFNVLENIYRSFDELVKVRRYPTSSADFDYEAKCDKPTDKREIYVMIIGEASRAANWQLYGYDRATNPRLSTEENLVVYKNVVTQCNATHKSVPLILSSVSADNHSEIYERRGIVQLYKDAGFRTLVVSCQAPNRSLIQMMCDEADQTIYMNGLNDGAMLEPLRETIAADTSDLFVVMHCYGSHFNYRERYPNQFSQYTPDDDVSISKKNRERMVNAYDNSIIYTDWFISEVISTLRQTDACSAMFYCADHGEDLYDDRRGRFLHSSPTITYYQAHVACVGWYSDEWRATYPEKAEAAVANTMAPASTHTVFHTTAQLAPIESPYIKPDVSLVSNEFDYAVERHYLDDHCKARCYGEIGFRREDWELLSQHNITDLR
ncbi:MAG: lipid A phosphoethanolamine transferase [Rikenellaceae bacterium]|nr:lipid A phosphoethanolamine transferase [Rikenellaceae bacterium]